MFYLSYLLSAYIFLQATERVMVYMDMAFKNASNHCSFTVSNEEVTSPSPWVWTFPKHWRYTNAVNNKLNAVFFCSDSFMKI